MRIYLVLFFLISYTHGSHYRGGSVSWNIRQSDYIANSSTVSVRIHQRHSWRRSAAPSFWAKPMCSYPTIANGSAILGESSLICTSYECYTSVSYVNQYISTEVLCTDFNEEYDYASGEKYTTITLPINKRLTYRFESCCWIPLLPIGDTPSWGLTLIINTNRRVDGKFNNAPVSTMQPIYRVEIGRTHVINIPMGDIDGDQLRCRWGNDSSETGGIYLPKGSLQANPCALTYQATTLGYEGVALIIEDFDTNNEVLSSIPLQFLIEVVPVQATTVTTTTVEHEGTGTYEPYTHQPTPPPPCLSPPQYLGDWRPGACIGVSSNNLTEIRIVTEIPCDNSSTSIQDILTISPIGMTRSNITQDLQHRDRYIMTLYWTPQSTQYGIHQFCVTPKDTNGQTGQTVCFNILVDVHSPQFIRGTQSPVGTVLQNQSLWTIETDVDIIPPTDRSISAVFYKRDLTGLGADTEVTRVSLVTGLYESRRITFRTQDILWEQGKEYYILLDGGVATINQSCGIQSSPIIDTQFWTFTVWKSEETSTPEVTIVEETSTPEETTESTTTSKTTTTTSSTTTPVTTSTAATTKRRKSTTTTANTISTTTSAYQNPKCIRWLPFGTIKNITTNENQKNYSFCFHVNTTFADVTIAANTWTPCSIWKTSGAADPLINLYNISAKSILLAQNDDGLSIPELNCYAGVISYRLYTGNYLVVIDHPKCNYGYFEIRLSAELTNESKSAEE